jgi:hypothetical protein
MDYITLHKHSYWITNNARFGLGAFKTSPEGVHNPCKEESTDEASLKSFAQLLLDHCVHL